MSAYFSRRTFVKTSALAATTVPLSQLINKVSAATSSASSGATPARDANASEKSGELPAPQRDPRAQLSWLEQVTPAEQVGVTWGMPWPRGLHARDAHFALSNGDGKSLPVQSWPLAYWPDGSLKWTAHAAVLGGDEAASFKIEKGEPGAVASGANVRVDDSAGEVVVDTGVVECRIQKKGGELISKLSRGGKEIARGGRLVGLRQNQPEESGATKVDVIAFTGETERVTVEQAGPVRAVVKIEGQHRDDSGRSWLPFTVRLYFYAGSEAVRMMHTFIFDGDEQKDFIRGLGVRFNVPMQDALQDRHIRFAGEGKGLWAEAVRPLTGLRRDAGKKARSAQIAGEKTPPENELPDAVSSHLQYVPAWGDFTLAQLSADGFQIKKRTKAGFGWIAAGAGHRAGGLGYVGGVSGGLVFGHRDFWQKHPTQIDIRGANTDLAEATLWLWSPEAPPMDLRFYHDEMGMDTYAKQTAGLDITYEDYEPGFGTPVGVARSNELFFWAVAATPSRNRFNLLADLVRLPPLLVAHPQHLASAGIFGGEWSLPRDSSPVEIAMEKRQDFLIHFYRNQVEQRRWYGFWDYGDVMHSYDADRHVWRYDIGGFAWDNSELSPDLWLWLSYLRTGRADIFRFAEAMTRHTGEVDVYHLGRFKGLGSRHNVQHWGCSAKQVRISNAAYRRFYYYLTGDERVGDLLRELVESHRAYLSLLPTRKIPGPKPEVPGPNGKAAFVSVGTDYGAIASAWLTEWERTGETKSRDRLLASMKGIGTLPHGFFSGGGMMNVDTGAITPTESAQRVSVSHLNAVFGLVEVCAELLQLLDAPEFKKAWLEYCELYNAPAEEQEKRLGKALKGTSLRQSHSRLTAYAAHEKKDAALAARAWKEFLGDNEEWGKTAGFKTVRYEGPDVLSPIDEAAWVSTNGSAQWGLAAIELLAWVPDAIPSKPSA
ncbi:MAG TPA: Tat pathway signal sequence domain protein [Opitutaceae bacterium]|nr:Tat pathway signal sequence domain protein [Opitutaceae bacterium]